MAFGGYDYEGFRDRTDEMETKRLDVAKAFEEFKKNNPYATASELQSAINQIAGPNPYLRAAGGTRQTVDELAKRNRQAYLEEQRNKLSEDMDFFDKQKKDAKEKLFSAYYDTGDFETAKNRVLSNLGAGGTGTEYEQLTLPRLEDFVTGLDKSVESQFVKRIFDENQDAMNDTIANYGSYDDFVFNLPNQNVANSPALKNAFNLRKGKHDSDAEAQVMQKVMEIASDPAKANLYRSGALSFFDTQFGPYFKANPQALTAANELLQTSQQTIHASQMGQLTIAAKEYATKQSDGMKGIMQNVIGSLTDYPDGVQQALRQINEEFRPQGSSSMSGIVAAVEALKDEDDIKAEDAKQRIISASGGALVSKAEFEGAIADSYISSTGRPKKLTTITAYSKELFDPESGDIPRRVKESANRVNDVTKPTEDYLDGKLGKFQATFGPQAYASHIADIDIEIARIQSNMNDIDQAVAYGQNQTNFLGTFGEDFNAQAVSENNASGQEAKQVLAAQLVQLQEAKNQVQSSLALAERRVQGNLTNRDISGAEVQRLAQEFLRMGGTLDMLTGQAPASQQLSPALRSPYAFQQAGPDRARVLREVLKQSGIQTKEQRDMYGDTIGNPQLEQNRLIQRLIDALQ